MPLKFFLKLYARLAGLTALVILLCVVLFVGINSVRSQFWHERFSEPLMRWLASSPAPEQQYHWLISQYDFRATGPSELMLSEVIRERLGYNQVVAVEASLGYRFLITGFHGEVLQFRASEPYRDIAVASAQILRVHLDAAGPEGREEAVERLAAGLNVTVLRVQGPDSLPDDEVLERVYNRGSAFYHDNGEGRVLVQLADGELIQVILPAPFNPWAWPVVLLLLVVKLCVLIVRVI